MIWSQKSPQQGDRLGPILFCLTVQPHLNSLQSPLTVAFMDDFTLGGPEDIVEQDIAMVTSTGANLGLNLNVNNTAIVRPNGCLLYTSDAADE